MLQAGLIGSGQASPSVGSKVYTIMYMYLQCTDIKCLINVRKMKYI